MNTPKNFRFAFSFFIHEKILIRTNIFFYDFIYFRKTKPFKEQYTEDDVDVFHERQRILKGQSKNDVLQMKNLTKVS